MNVVFVNSFEKRVEDGRTVPAKVSIAEQHGVWHVLWSEPNGEGESESFSWFEGSSWQEMLSAFRFRLAEKAGDGFLPLIEGAAEEDGFSGRFAFARMLQHYSEMHANDDLFEQLRKWRREAALKEHKPSYILSTDRVLRMIACFIPQSEQDLLSIPGFGKHKNALYGKAILAITAKYPQTTGFPLDWVAERVDDYQFKLWMYKQRELKLKAEHERKEARKKLLEMVSGGQRLEDIVKALNMNRRELVLWIEQLDEEGYELGQWIEDELKLMPPEELESARKAMSEEGDRYLKPVLSRMFSEEELKDKDLDRMYEWLRFVRLRYRKEKDAEKKVG